MDKVRSITEIEAENQTLRLQLNEANDTIDAIRNGEIDALVVDGKNGHELYTLQSADRAYRMFIEKMSEGAITANPDGLILFCNSSFLKLIGQSSESLIATPLVDHIAFEDRERFDILLGKALSVDVKDEFSIRTNSLVIPVQLSVTSFNVDEGMLLSIIVTDLTSQKDALRAAQSHSQQLQSVNIELEKSNHDLQQFASVASHDLQEPLRKIQVFSHLLKTKFSSELTEISSSYLNKIVHAANRMKVLIIDILNYSRLSAKDISYSKTDISDMIRELLLDLELAIKEKSAVIQVAELPEVEINPGQMRQVFQNLISNALKFTKKGVPPLIKIFSGEPPVDFTPPTDLDQQYCHLHFKDNGIGFDSKYSDSIFNLFEKLHSKDDYDGTGIGLAIAKKIIEKHQGQINVTSEVGVGTEFILSLPISQH